MSPIKPDFRIYLKIRIPECLTTINNSETSGSNEPEEPAPSYTEMRQIILEKFKRGKARVERLLKKTGLDKASNKNKRALYPGLVTSAEEDGYGYIEELAKLTGTKNSAFITTLLFSELDNEESDESTDDNEDENI